MTKFPKVRKAVIPAAGSPKHSCLIYGLRPVLSGTSATGRAGIVMGRGLYE